MLGAGGIAAAAATRGLSGRPLDPFGAVTPMLLGFYRKFSEPQVRWINTRTLYAEATN